MEEKEGRNWLNDDTVHLYIDESNQREERVWSWYVFRMYNSFCIKSIESDEGEKNNIYNLKNTSGYDSGRVCVEYIEVAIKN